jgi:hypothetical protein
VKLATEVLPLVPVTATIVAGCAPVKARRRLRQRAARVVGDDQGHRPVADQALRARSAPSRLVSTADGAHAHGVGGELGAVERDALQGREEMARLRVWRLSTLNPVIARSGGPAGRAPAVDRSSPSAPAAPGRPCGQSRAGDGDAVRRRLIAASASVARLQLRQGAKAEQRRQTRIAAPVTGAPVQPAPRRG